METNWSRYNNGLRQTTVGKIPQYFHWNAYKQLLKNLKPDRKYDILELGSGTGYNSLNICKTLDTKSITLVDLNNNALNYSKKLFKNLNLDTQFIKRDVAKFNTKRKFDLVHSHGLIEHFPQEERNLLIKKHLWLAKPEGYIIIFVPTPTGTYIPLRKICELLGIWPFPDENPILLKDFLTEINKYKIKVIATITYYVFYPTIGILLKKIR